MAKEAGALPWAWANVLAAVEATLNRSLVEVAHREHYLDSLASLNDDSAAEARTCDHERLGEQIRDMQGLQAKAVRAVEEIDLEFAADEAKLRDFLQRAEQQRLTLADWAARAIG